MMNQREYLDNISSLALVGHTPSSRRRQMVPNPQEPYKNISPSRSMKTINQMKHISDSLSLPANVSLSSHIRTNSNNIRKSFTSCPSKSEFFVPTKENFLIPVRRPNDVLSVVSSQEQTTKQFYIDLCDEFFKGVKDKRFSLEVEKFIRQHIVCSECVHWEDVTSVQRLYSERLQVSLSRKTLVGGALHEKVPIKLAQAQEHSMYNPDEESLFMKPTAPAIVFSLRDASGFVTSVVSIQKRFTRPQITLDDELFISVFQQRYEFISQFISQQTHVERELLKMAQLMSLEQFLIMFDMVFKNLFNCKQCEIWDLSKDNEPTKYTTIGKRVYNSDELGIISHIVNRRQMFNCFNILLDSNYQAATDGYLEIPLLGVPVYPSLHNKCYLVVLRGNSKGIFTTQDEKNICYMAPYVITYFLNAVKFSSLPNSAPGLDLLQGIMNFLPKFGQKKSLEELLGDGMMQIQKATHADRVTFYNVGSKKQPGLISQYHSGCRVPIRLKPGQGVAGHVAVTGVELNLINAKDSEYFDQSCDIATGYDTKSMMTIPVIGNTGKVRGIIQLLNKAGNEPFSQRDFVISTVYGALCASMSQSSSLFTKLGNMRRRIEIMALKNLFDYKGDLYTVLATIAKCVKESVMASHATIYLMDYARKCLRGYVASGPLKTSNIVCDIGAAFKCFNAKEVLLINDPLLDPNTDVSFDKGKVNILCLPLYTFNKEIIGVLEVANKIGDRFNDNDANTLSVFAVIIALYIRNMELEKIVRFGSAQKDLVYYLTDDEYDSCSIPNSLRLNINILSEDYCPLSFSEDQILSTAFEIFEQAGLMEKYTISSSTLFKFFYDVKKYYFCEYYHSWVKAVDSMQYMFMQLKQCGFLTSAGVNEIFSLLVASLLSYIGHDGTDDPFHIRIESAQATISNNKDVLHRIHLHYAYEILNKHIPLLISDTAEQPVMKESILSLIMSHLTDDMSVQQLTDILDSNHFDINCFSHRPILLKVMFKCSLYSDLARPTPIPNQWEQVYSRERFALGELEVQHGLTYSHANNCKELYNMFVAISERFEVAKPYLTVISRAVPDLSPFLKIFNDNMYHLEAAKSSRN